MLTGKSYDDFREAWSKFDPKGSGYIETGDLVALGSLLDPPLGYRDQPEQLSIFEDWIKFADIPVYNENYHHFYEVAILLSKRVYHEKRENEGEEGELEGDQRIFVRLRRKT